MCLTFLSVDHFITSRTGQASKPIKTRLSLQQPPESNSIHSFLCHFRTMLFKFKHILVFIGAMIASAAAAPVPSRGGSDKWLNVKRVRQLAELLGPALAALEPLAQG